MAAEQVAIEIGAVDEATRIFEQVQQSSQNSAQEMRQNFQEVEQANEDYQDSLSASETAQETLADSGEQALSSTADSWSEAAGATDEYEDAMNEVVDAKQAMADESAGIMGMIKDNWMMVAAGAGMAVEGMTRKLQEGEFTVRRVANATDHTAESIRNMAREMADATMSFDEAAQLMEIARQRGLESEKQLRAFTQQWDTVGDATGENAIALAEASTVLQAMGHDAADTEKAYAALGYVSRETTMAVSEFMRSTERVAPQLRDMGIGLNETAALMGMLEDEGLSGRYAMRELRRAINEADGSMEEMLSIMDLSQEEFAEYTQQVEDSNTVIEENAEAYKETRTTLQELRATFEGVAGQAYGFFQVLSNIAVPLALVGPKIASLVGGTTALTAAKTALLGVLGAVASPVLAIAAAVTALVAVLVYFRDEIRAVGGALTGIFVSAFQSVLGFLGGIPKQFYEMGANLINSLVGGFMSRVRNAINRVRNAVGNIVSAAKNVIGMSSPAQAFIDIGEGMGEGLTKGIEDMQPQLVAAGRMAGQTPAEAAEQHVGVNMREGERGGQTGQGVQINQDINIESPEPLDERDIRKENEKFLKRANLEYKMRR